MAMQYASSDANMLACDDFISENNFSTVPVSCITRNYDASVPAQSAANTPGFTLYPNLAMVFQSYYDDTKYKPVVYSSIQFSCPSYATGMGISPLITFYMNVFSCDEEARAFLRSTNVKATYSVYADRHGNFSRHDGHSATESPYLGNGRIDTLLKYFEGNGAYNCWVLKLRCQ